MVALQLPLLLRSFFRGEQACVYMGKCPELKDAER